MTIQAAGGLISASLLSVTGASSFYKGGLCLYTLESRTSYASWTQSNIDSYNGPSTTVVASFTEPVRMQLGATYCIGESGMAGPKLSQERLKQRGLDKGELPKNLVPGYVALAVASEKGTFNREITETGHGEDRAVNMVQFAVEGLKLLRDVIKGDAKL